MAKARQDDPSIDGHVRLWRRIPNWPNCRKFDEKLQKERPSSSNFRDEENELSVNLASETSVEQMLVGNDGFGIVELSAAFVRQIVGTKLVLCRDPIADNPGHVLLCGKISRPQAEKLAKSCQWVVMPVDLEAGPDPKQDQQLGKSRKIGLLVIVVTGMLLLVAIIALFLFRT